MRVHVESDEIDISVCQGATLDLQDVAIAEIIARYRQETKNTVCTLRNCGIRQARDAFDVNFHTIDAALEIRDDVNAVIGQKPERIVAGTTSDQVISCAAYNEVVAVAAFQLTKDKVGSGCMRAIDFVIAVTTVEDLTIEGGTKRAGDVTVQLTDNDVVVVSGFDDRITNIPGLDQVVPSGAGQERAGLTIGAADFAIKNTRRLNLLMCPAQSLRLRRSIQGYLVSF